MKSRNEVVLRLAAVATLITMLVLTVAGPAGAAAPTPAYGAAIVDGNPNEWNLTSDWFAKQVFLRYDCATETAYVLALGGNRTDIFPVLVEDNGVFIKIDGHKVAAPPSANFAWVGQRYDGIEDHAKGFEASFALAPGAYALDVRFNIDVGRTETSGTVPGLTFTPSCEPNAVTLLSFTVAPLVSIEAALAAAGALIAGALALRQRR